MDFLLATNPVSVKMETHTWSIAQDYSDTFVFPTDGNGCNIVCVEISSAQVEQKSSLVFHRI